MKLDYKAIGKRIKAARIRMGITQEQLADRVSVPPTHLSNIEIGSSRVSLTTIVKIANVLNVTIDDLLCDNLVKDHSQFERNMKSLMNGCNDHVVHIRM